MTPFAFQPTKALFKRKFKKIEVAPFFLFKLTFPFSADAFPEGIQNNLDGVAAPESGFFLV